jgi:septal ring factor EnvC (AmiA/AmiB activator)
LEDNLDTNGDRNFDKELAQEEKKLRIEKVKAETEKSKAEADKAREEVNHEKAKIEKTKAETNNTKNKKWFDLISTVVTVGTFVTGAITVYDKIKKKKLF